MPRPRLPPPVALECNKVHQGSCPSPFTLHSLGTKAGTSGGMKPGTSGGLKPGTSGGMKAGTTGARQLLQAVPTGQQVSTKEAKCISVEYIHTHTHTHAALGLESCIMELT